MFPREALIYSRGSRFGPQGRRCKAPRRSAIALTMVQPGNAADASKVLLPGDSRGGRAPQRIQDKAQPAGNGLRPFQGLQRRLGSSGALPLGEPGPSIRRMLAARRAGACSVLQAPRNEPGSGRPRCCASRQGRRPFPSRRALRPTASRLAATVTITWKEYDRAKPRRGRAFALPGAALLVAHWQRANHAPRALPGERRDSGAIARIMQSLPRRCGPAPWWWR